MSQTQGTLMSAPTNNLRIYELLYALEVVLRELIITELRSVAGPKWWKSRLPSDLVEKWQAGQKYERKSFTVGTTPHHPLYYLDFPDLRKIIERRDNWNDVFDAIFHRQDIVSVELSLLEPIRNKVAHSRVATAQDWLRVQAAVDVVIGPLGPRAHDLFEHPTASPNIRDRLLAIGNEAQSAADCCLKYREMVPFPVWEDVNAQWWFDEDYLHSSLGQVHALFTLYAEYSTLPRHRGEGFQLEAWVRRAQVPECHRAAVAELEAILSTW